MSNLKCIDRSHSVGTTITLALVLLLGALPTSAKAQSAAPASKTVVGSFEGTVPTILRIESVGSPVQLADGQTEQRYKVIANVPFAITSRSGRSQDLIVAEGATESSAASYAGAPGYHGEIRIRAAANTPVAVDVKPRDGR